jgi:hypothetical protein
VRFRGVYIPRRVQREMGVADLRFMSIVGSTGYTYAPHDGTVGKLIDLGLMETFDCPRFGPDLARLSTLGLAIVSRLQIDEYLMIQPNTAAGG